MTIIVHISNDYPDPMVPDKTSAVASLVNGTPEFRHIVYSLNRIDGWKGMTTLPFGEDRTAIAYKALPKGLLWEPRLKEIAQWIEGDLKARGIAPDLVEAHKFTVEGLIGSQLARAFGKPLVCDIQGDTDTKILGIKKKLHPRYREIAEQAKIIFPYALWPLDDFAEKIGLNRDKCRLLPVVPGQDCLTASPVTHANHLVTVFNLDSWKRKNIEGMAQAVRILRATVPDIRLDVYGRGKPASVIGARDAIATAGMDTHIRLTGPVANGALPEILGRYAGFVLPSRRESYGLVYAEALFAGLPVLFGRNRAIDGILPTETIGVSCDPNDADDIARGMLHLLTHQAELKTRIAALQSNGGLEILRKQHILDTYRAGLREALAA